ncbi:hypothetical protein EYF80_055409 [Liparis tanakae]|uniref:Uncharacterized protein n=1 Tax=Liparis tanakae TaxID=230148 RepID=A0A4Z2F084_9TELE|nr:hypothetical protein EYF80_055409 [Liparis tanakae]
MTQRTDPLTADHLSEQLLGGVPEERDAAHQELVEDDPHGPPVHRLPVALPQDHLGGDVLRSATHLHINTGELWGNDAGRRSGRRDFTCLSMNSLVSFSTWPSYRLVVMFIRPIFDRPKSVSLMWPMDVISRLEGEETTRHHRDATGDRADGLRRKTRRRKRTKRMKSEEEEEEEED